MKLRLRYRKEPSVAGSISSELGVVRAIGVDKSSGKSARKAKATYANAHLVNSMRADPDAMPPPELRKGSVQAVLEGAAKMLRAPGSGPSPSKLLTNFRRRSRADDSSSETSSTSQSLTPRVTPTNQYYPNDTTANPLPVVLFAAKDEETDANPVRVIKVGTGSRINLEGVENAGIPPRRLSPAVKVKQRPPLTEVGPSVVGGAERNAGNARKRGGSVFDRLFGLVSAVNVRRPSQQHEIQQQGAIMDQQGGKLTMVGGTAAGRLILEEPTFYHSPRPETQSFCYFEEEFITQARIEEAFLVFDRSGSGLVSVQDVSTVLQSFGIRYSEADLRRFLGLNKVDDLISLEEFQRILATTKADPEVELRHAFEMLDTDGDGLLSANDLREGLLKLGVDVTDAEIEEMVKQADKDGDHHINFQEFREMQNCE